MRENDLTVYEEHLVEDPEILLAKNRIIKKVTDMFAVIAGQYVAHASLKLSAGLTVVPPKISKGEQYLGLPYVVLDYPRIFAKQNTLAVRTLFWWGNHFSIHLLMSGTYKLQYQARLQQIFENDLYNDWYAGVGESEWNHHFEEDNYRPLNDLMWPYIFEKKFLKVAKKIPLNRWNNVQEILLEDFKLLMEAITI